MLELRASTLLCLCLLAGCATSPATPSPTVAATPEGSPSQATGHGTSPTPAIGADRWPFVTTGEISDVLFAPDGRLVVVEGDLGAETSRVTTLTADGAIVDGWPWAAPPTGDWIARAALGPDDSVYVAVRGAQGIPSTYTWTLHRLDPAGSEVPGFPVSLPSGPFCSLHASDGVAYAVCQQEAEGTGEFGSSTVTAILPDGSTAAGWPVQVAGSASLIGFAPDGAAFIGSGFFGSGDDQNASIAAYDRDGATLPGWPQATRPLNGDAGIDRQGRVWFTSYEWTEGQCGPAARTVYTMLGVDGSVPAGWPVSVSGWASGPAIAADGVMYVAQDSQLASAYAASGVVVPGWPANGVDVAVGCYAGTRPVLAGDDGVVILSNDQVTMIRRDGEVAPGWPVQLPYAGAVTCPFCTPGPGAPVDPAIGELGVWVAAYDGDVQREAVRPRLVGIDRTGSLPPAWQQPFGRAGDEVLWLRVAPAGGVFAAVTFDLGGDQSRSALYRLADDRPVSR